MQWLGCAVCRVHRMQSVECVAGNVQSAWCAVFTVPFSTSSVPNVDLHKAGIGIRMGGGLGRSEHQDWDGDWHRTRSRDATWSQYGMCVCSPSAGCTCAMHTDEEHTSRVSIWKWCIQPESTSNLLSTAENGACKWCKRQTEYFKVTV